MTVAPYEKLGWTKEVIETEVQNGRLTSFDDGSTRLTAVNALRCAMCENCFHRLNQLNCCKKMICSNCLISTLRAPGNGLSRCPYCRREASYRANVKESDVACDKTESLETFKWDEGDKYDILVECAKLVGLTEKEVDEILMDGWFIDTQSLQLPTQ